MFITQAFAQAAPAGPGSADLIGMIFPMVAIIVVFYFFMIRPQQQKQKQQQALLSQVTRGDTVVTHGGLIGKVVRVVDDQELLVEVGENVKVRVLRNGLSDVRAKTEPVKASDKKA